MEKYEPKSEDELENEDEDLNEDKHRPEPSQRTHRSIKAFDDVPSGEKFKSYQQDNNII